MPTPQSPTITSLDILVARTDLVTAEIEASLHTLGGEEVRGKRGGGRWFIILLGWWFMILLFISILSSLITPVVCMSD